MQKHGGHRMVTAKDVAEACGVSQATVSYVINNSAAGRISEATRARVLEMSRKIGYCPSQSARSMRINRAMAIGVVMGGNTISLGVSHALRGVKRCMDAAGYAQVLLNADDETSSEAAYLKAYRAGRIDGLMFLFYDLTDELKHELRAQGVPYLALSEQGITGADVSLSSRYDAALKDCARLMRSKGYARARYYSVQSQDVISHKYEMLREALASEYPEAQLERVTILRHERNDEQIIEELLSSIGRGEFDISITPNPRVGWMMQNVIMRDHMAVPQKIKHICLSSAYPFKLIYPSITMIDIPIASLGTAAAERMLYMLDDKRANPQGASALEHAIPSCSLEEGMSTL